MKVTTDTTVESSLTSQSQDPPQLLSVADAEQLETAVSSVQQPQPAQQPHPLLRNGAAGMNPVTLITGFYGPRGERIRHQVHEGALRLPQSALDLIVPKDDIPSTTGTTPSVTNSYTLPDLDEVKRPSLDFIMNPLIVTEVRNEDIVQEDISPIDGTIQTTTYTKTIVTNRSMVRPPLSVVVAAACANNDTTINNKTAIERIRGGGGVEGDEEKGDDAKSAVLQPAEDVTQLAHTTTTATNSIQNTNTSVQRQQQQQPSDLMAASTMTAVQLPPASVTEVVLSSVPMVVDGPLPMDVDPEIVPTGSSQVSGADNTLQVPPPTTTTKPISVLPTLLSVATVVPAPLTTTTVPVMVAQPADPTLQQQQISNLEKALLSAVNSSSVATTIGSSSSSIPVVPTSTGPTVSSIAPILPEMKTPAVVESSTAVSGSNMSVTKPVAVTSIGTPTISLPVKEPKAAQQHVIPLTKRPLERYETQKGPANTTGSSKDTTTTTTSQQIKNYPDWYKPDRVSALERAVLSEWFDGSASHRTEQTFVEAREKIIAMSTTIGADHYLTGTMVRRAIASDAGSLLRLHAFLTSYAMINQNAINESTPTPMVLLRNKKAKVTKDWNTNDAMKINLLHAVVEQSRNMPATTHSELNDCSIDWNDVAKSVGNGVTAMECEHKFLTMSIPTAAAAADNRQRTDGSVTPDVVSITTKSSSAPENPQLQHVPLATKKQIQQDLICDIVNNIDPVVIHAVTNAALSSTNGNVQQAQSAARLGLMVHDVADAVRQREDNVVQVLSEVMELRMRRIEGRLSALDDVEDMLEAERVALELERRDLYTARCRHWFGGT